MLTNKDKIKAVNYNGTAIPLDTIKIDLTKEGTFYKEIFDKTISNINHISYLSEIKQYAFMGCSKLSYVYNENIKSIYQNAFYECPVLMVELPNCISISQSAFYNHQSLRSFIANNLTIIDNSAFYGCRMLSNVSIAKCSTINTNAFNGCSNLSEVYAPNLKYIGNSAFTNCYKLNSTFDFTNVEWLGSNAFGYCSQFKHVNLPKLTTIGSCPFINCSSLYTVSVPLLSSFTDYCFAYRKYLQSVYMPKATYIGTSAFHECHNLVFDLPSTISYIGAGAFNLCSNLSAIRIFNNDNIHLNTFNGCLKLSCIMLNNKCVLLSSNAFTNTPLINSAYLNYYGSIYVPSDLVSWYKTATNWNYYSDRITSIENLPEEYKEWQE